MLLCFSYKWSALKLLLTLYVPWFSIFISGFEPTYLNYTCPLTTTYTPNSTYQINLNSLLSSLSSPNITGNNFFHNATAGNSAPDRVYGLFMCRGDVTIDTCRDCVATATRDIIKKCPKEKEAIIWYDECMLRYDNRYIFSTMEEDPKVFIVRNERFTDTDTVGIVGEAFDKLAARASSGESTNSGQLKYFATGEIDFPVSPSLYCLLQCTPDLARTECSWCLRVIIAQLPTCCRRKKGARVLLPSCTFRWEIYRFYNTTSPPPAPSSSTSLAGKWKIIASVVAVVVSILLFILGICFLRRRAKKFDAAQKAIELDGSEILKAESLRYDLITIEDATNNFSAENKVGEGGFGNVFKGMLFNGQEIAVKRLSKRSGQGEQEFKNEVLLVAKLQHKNLARLVGFCLEREERILIYEFVPNKSLDYFLFGSYLVRVTTVLIK